MTMNVRRSRTTHAFTMIELMLVISIMMIIGLLAALGISEVIEHAKVVETEATMHLMEIALEQFKADMGHYPVASKGTGESLETFIDALTDPSSSYGWERASVAAWFPKRSLVVDEVDGNPEIRDAWDMDFQYCRKDEYNDVNGTAVERTPGKQDYYNLNTFQLYSYGPNIKTCPGSMEAWLDAVDSGGQPEMGHNRLLGTEQDDIRNWTQETFYSDTPTAYGGT